MNWLWLSTHWSIAALASEVGVWHTQTWACLIKRNGFYRESPYSMSFGAVWRIVLIGDYGLGPIFALKALIFWKIVNCNKPRIIVIELLLSGDLLYIRMVLRYGSWLSNHLHLRLFWQRVVRLLEPPPTHFA